MNEEIELVKIYADSQGIHKTMQQLEKGEISLSHRTVLVIDEAAMVPTRLMYDLFKKVLQESAKIILVGDTEQLQSIEAGGAFLAFSKHLGAAQLTEIQRQEEPWARQAVKDFHKGDAAEGLKAFAAQGLLTISDDRTVARRELITAWSSEGVAAPTDNIILAATRQDVRLLNRDAQEERAKAFKLGKRSVLHEGGRFYQGDRVVITKNSRIIGVRNGDLGTVKDIDGKKIVIELDRGVTARINLDNFNHAQLGYAITTHKAQGITAKNAFVLGGGVMTDKHQAVVQVSRARGKTRVFIERAQAGGLAQISRQMSRSNKKELAIEQVPTLKVKRGIRF